jgi:hypothetical protein
VTSWLGLFVAFIVAVLTALLVYYTKASADIRQTEVDTQQTEADTRQTEAVTRQTEAVTRQTATNALKNQLDAAALSQQDLKRQLDAAALREQDLKRQLDAAAQLAFTQRVYFYFAKLTNNSPSPIALFSLCRISLGSRPADVKQVSSGCNRLGGGRIR